MWNFKVSCVLLLTVLPYLCSGRGWHLTRNTGDSVKLAYCYVDPVARSRHPLPPVIMLHGMLDSKMTWHDFAPQIAKYTGRRVYYLDARNHGNSPWSKNFNFDILADDVLNFMDKHRIPRAILVGHSMGGKTAMTAALRAPQRVEKLVVEDMSLRNLSPEVLQSLGQTTHALRQFIAAVPNGADEITARQTVAQLMSAKLPPELVPASKEEPERSLMQLPIKQSESGGYAWKTNIDFIEKTLMTPGALDQNLYGRYTKDTLFIYGTDSSIQVAKDAPLIPKFFPQAQFKAIPGAGHLIHHQHPKIFANELISFINARPAGRIGWRSKF